MGVVVGDPNCSFVNVANVMTNTQFSGALREKLIEIFQRLEVDSDKIYQIKQRLHNGEATCYESIMVGLESWSAKFGTSSTINKLSSVLQQCNLESLADTLKSHFCNIGALNTKRKRFARIPEAVTLALKYSDKLMVIKTMSQMLLYEWIEETVSGNIVLIDDIVNLYLQPESPEKLFIVAKIDDNSLFETMEKLKGLDNKIVLVAEQRHQNDDSSDTLPAAHIIQHKINWQDLVEDYQRDLMNKLFLIGQRQTTLMSILKEIGPINFKTMLNNEFLTNLVLGKAQLFPLKVPLALSYYITRRLIPRKQVNVNILKDTSKDTFVFTGLTRSELSIRISNNENTDISTSQVQKHNLDARFILLELNSDFKIICEKAREAVHLLHYHDDGLTWIASKGPMSRIQKHVVTTNIILTEDEFIEFVEAEQKPFFPLNPIILSDSPGMGKSVLFEQIARTISLKFADRIVIFLRLEEFIKRIKTVVIIDLFDAFVTMVCDGNKLSETILLNNSKHPSTSVVEIFIDGFDEVDVAERNIAETLLTTIQSKFSEGRVRIWVATRPHLLDMLENLLNVLGYNIQPFVEHEQIQFLQSFWTEAASRNNKALHEERLKQFSEQCLSSIKFKIGKHERDIAGIPLQCLLIAEAFLRNAIEYCDPTNVINEKATLTFKVHGMADLYKRLINAKLKKYQKVYCKPDKENWKQKRSKLLDLHTQISHDLIFPGHFTQPLAAFTNSDDFQDLCNVGVVESRGSGSVPRFIHRTFAEYFVAAYIVSGLYKSKDFKNNLLRYVFNTTGHSAVTLDEWNSFNVQVKKNSFEQSVVCYFIDNLIAKNVESGNSIPICNEETANMYLFISAAIAEDCMSLFRFFTGKHKWTTHIISKDMIHIDSNEDKKSEISRNIENLLFLTVRYSQPELVRLVLNDFKDAHKCASIITLPTVSKITLLHVAVKFREFTVVSELMNNWYNNTEELNGLVHFCISETVFLEEALINEKVEILQLICLKNSNVSNTKFEELAPLHVSHVHPRLESTLLAHGAEINVKTDDRGRTLLHTRSGAQLHNFLVEILRSEQRKQDCQQLVLVKDKLEGFTPLHRHICRWSIPQPDTLKIFRDLGADFNSVNKDGESIMKSVIRLYRNEEEIRSLIDYGADINRRGVDGKSLYHFAISKANLAAVNVLIEKGLDVNIQDEVGNTPLHYLIRFSAKKSVENIASLLAGHGARLDIQNCDGYKPLDFSIMFRTHCVPVLSMNLLNVLHNSHNGVIATMNTLLQTVVLSTTDEVAEEGLKLAKELVTNGAELTFEPDNEHGNSLLFLALELVCLPMIVWLVESGVQVNSENLFGNTPLHHLLLMSLRRRNCELGELKVFNYLLSRGSNINKRNFENDTVMDIALKNGTFIFVQVCKIIANGKIHFCKKLLTKALHTLAVSIQYPQDCDLIESLVKHGALVNHQDCRGNTVLHLAAKRRATDWVKYFLSVNANPQIQNTEMRLPFHMLYCKDFEDSNSDECKTPPCIELAQMLLPEVNNVSNKVTYNVYEWITLHEAICLDDTKTFSILLEDKSQHKYTFSDEFVWFVIGCRSLDVITEFCDAYKSNGFKLTNLGLKEATSALHVAVMQSESSIVQYFLEEQGFFETLTSPRMSNLIHKLVKNSNTEPFLYLEKKWSILEYLWTLNHDLVNATCFGISPLLTDNIHLDLIEMLIEKDADATLVNDHGHNLAHLAVQYLKPYQYCSLVRFLYDKGYRSMFQAKGDDGCTVLHTLVTNWIEVKDYLSAVNLFETSEVDFNSLDKNGQSVLVYAVMARCYPDLEVIMVLVNYGCLWNTLFTNVSKDDTLAMLKRLIFIGVDILRTDTNGDCISGLVRRYFNTKIATILLKDAKRYENGQF